MEPWPCAPLYCGQEKVRCGRRKLTSPADHDTAERKQGHCIATKQVTRNTATLVSQTAGEAADKAADFAPPFVLFGHSALGLLCRVTGRLL
jgi:hypothetical protein